MFKVYFIILKGFVLFHSKIQQYFKAVECNNKDLPGQNVWGKGQFTSLVVI